MYKIIGFDSGSFFSDLYSKPSMVKLKDVYFSTVVMDSFSALLRVIQNDLSKGLDINWMSVEKQAMLFFLGMDSFKTCNKPLPDMFVGYKHDGSMYLITNSKFYQPEYFEQLKILADRILLLRGAALRIQKSNNGTEAFTYESFTNYPFLFLIKTISFVGRTFHLDYDVVEGEEQICIRELVL